MTTSPETITIDADGKEMVAVVSSVGARPTANRMVREVDGVRYAISIAMGSIPGYPDVGLIAHPVID